MRQGSAILTFLGLAFLLLACGSPKSAIYQRVPNNSLVDNNDDGIGATEENLEFIEPEETPDFGETDGASDFSEKFGIIVEVSELQALYPNVEALVKRAEEINISSCIILDGGAQVYSGFGPCIEARTFGSVGISPVVPNPIVTPNPVMPEPVTDPILNPIVMPPPLHPGYGNASCAPTPRHVTIVDAGILSQQFKKKLHNPPDGNHIIAFKVRVPIGADSYSDFRATKTSAARSSKFISVSQCPGDYTNPVAGNIGACTRFGLESSRLYMTSNQDAPTRGNCILQQGQTYYINAVAVESLDSTRKTCSDPTSCGFFSSRHVP